MILNLTQHQATPEQAAAGVPDLPADLRANLVSLLTFDDVPSRHEMAIRAHSIARLAFDYCLAQAVESLHQSIQLESVDSADLAESLYILRRAERMPAAAIEQMQLRGTAAMIGGAPFFMSALEKALIEVGVQPLYAFSRRESVESVGADGTVSKTSVFRHAGFVGGAA